MSSGEFTTIVCIFGACGVLIHYCHAFYTIFEKQGREIAQLVMSIVIAFLGVVQAALYVGWLFETF